MDKLIFVLVVLTGVLKVWNYWWGRIELFIKKFNLIIKQCYCIVWSVEKRQMVVKPDIVKTWRF